MPARPSLSRVAEIARARDPDRFLCALFAPAERREALFALIAYGSELARARALARNPIAALMRLQWWRETVEAAAAGRPPPRHEVAEPLHGAIAAGLLPAAELLAMADAREAETEEEGIPTRAAFEAYLRGAAGGLAVAAGRLLGVREGTALAALQEAGALYGLAGVLRGVPTLAAQRRCLLPRDALGEQGLGMEAVLAAPEADAVREVVARLAASGEARCRACALALRGLPPVAIAAALPLVLARRDLRRLARGGGGTRQAGRGLGDRVAVLAAGLRGRV
jgi:phytoene synthase